MKTTRRLAGFLSAMAILAITSSVTQGGGWATLTIANLPDYFVVGKPVPLTFLVRAHGVTLVDGMQTAVTAHLGTEKEIQFASSPTGNTGEYKTVVTLPKPGEWTIRINSGWMGIPFDLVPMKAIAVGSPAPTISEIERGERLFVTSGCIGCHENKDVRSTNFVQVGPSLTGRRFPTDMLKTFLKDPSLGFGGKKDAKTGEMPNLRLDPRDLDSIVAFLNRPRT